MEPSLILQAEYASIIISLIKRPYRVNSITKLIFISFGVKHASIRKYSNRKMDFIKTFLSSLSIKLTSHPEELKAILDVISILETEGWISVDGDIIKVKKMFPDDTCKNKFLINIEKKPINHLEEISNLNIKSFLEEVLQYV